MNQTIIAFDTNIWIALAYNNDAFKEIKTKVENRDIILVVSDVIKLEWARNKPKKIEERCAPISKAKEKALSLTKYIADKTERAQMIQSINQSSQRAYEENKAKYENEFNTVENLINSCPCFTTKDEDKLYVANLAIEKRPPLNNNKNNFNDALLVRSFYKYVIEKRLADGDVTPNKYDLVYVSNNSQDFIDSETKEIYTTIIEDLEYPLKVINSKCIGDSLKLSNEIIEDEDFEEWLISRIEDQAYLEWEISRGK
jgi:hypothetical protein